MPRYARCLNTICRIRVSIVPPRCNRNVTIGSRQPKHFRSDVMADLDNNFLLCSTERPTCAPAAHACGEPQLAQNLLSNHCNS